MRKILALGLALMLSLSVVTSNVMAIEKDDVKRYLPAGLILSTDGIISGTDSGLEPMMPLTREQAIAITVRMNGWDKEYQNYQPTGIFRDVPPHHWAAKYVEIAYLQGIAKGIGDNKFGLGMMVTKKQFLSYMLRTLGHSADWDKENIMEKARKLNLSLDTEEEGGDQMARGQSFLYMLNTLLQTKNGKSEALYSELGLKNNYFKDNDQNKNNKNDNDNNTKKSRKITKETLDYSEYPKPIAASTPTFDELKVEFNTLIANPQKSNFVFSLSDGRTIKDSDYTIAGGGREIIFHFKSQNLHGKTLTCTINNLMSSKGKKMLGEGKITATYKDFTPIYFKNYKIMSKKQYETFLSIDIKKGSKPCSYSVTSDGVELTEGVDYKMSWGGRRFSPLFIREETYPKSSSTLTIWGWVTSPYEKYLDEPISITVDFEGDNARDFDAPPAREQEEPSVDFVIDDDALDKELDELNKNITEDCTAPYIVKHEFLRNKIYFTTESLVKEIKGLKLRDITGNLHRLDYTIDPEKPGFTVYTPGMNEEPDLLIVDNIICKNCKAETGPIEYNLGADNGGEKEKAPFIIGWKKVNDRGVYFFETLSMVGEIEDLKVHDINFEIYKVDYTINSDKKGFTVYTGNISIVPERLLIKNIISKKDKIETGGFEYSLNPEVIN